MVAVLGLASFLLAVWVLRRQTREPETPRARTLAAVWTQFKTGVREILLDRRVFLTSNMEGVQNLSLGALEAFLPIYAVKMAHLSALQAGLLWGVQMVATIASKPIMGRCSDLAMAASPCSSGGCGSAPCHLP